MSLIPRQFKWLGLILIVIAGFLYFYFDWYNIRLEVPVFAVYSSFMRTRYFVFSRTNFTDELTLLLALAGFMMIVFSKEKNESDEIKLVRYKSLVQAVFINSLFMAFSILFIYGSGFIAMLVFNVISVYLIYLIIFAFQRRKSQRK